MNQQEILRILSCAGKPDLSVPESKKQAIIRNKVIAPYLQSLTAEAEKFRGTAIPALPYSYFKLFHETGDRWYYEDSERGYFPRRGRLAAFAVLAWLYGKEEDCHELEDIIWAICDEYTWSVPAHVKAEAYTTQLEDDAYMVDLFASETADALAEISFLMGDKLPQIIRLRIAHLLEKRIFSRVLEDTFGWMSTTNNWAAVCAGSVGMAAIYAIDDDEHLAAVLERILPAFDHFLSGFAADGSCLEGIGYWNYGFSYFVSFADLLYRRTNGGIDLFANEMVEKIAHFQQKCYFKGGRTVSFSDGGSRASYLPGLTSYLSRKYEGIVIPPASSMADFNEDHCHRWSNVLRNLLWTVDTLEEAPVYGCYPLPAAQWYICSGENGVGIAAKGGHNAEPHNHNDVGGFQIYKNGEEILSDLGSGEYTRQYFSGQRYTFFVCGSQGHTVPMVDGCTQKPGEAACAKDVSVDENGISMDIAPAYGLAEMPSLRRSLRFCRETGATELTDVYTFTTGTHEVRERFITYGTVQLESGRAVIRSGEETMTICYDPAVFTPEVTAAQYAAHFGVQKHLFTLDLVARAEGELTAAFTIEP